MEFKEVTREEFYKRLYADPRDIMPKIQPGDYPWTSLWKAKGGAVFGKTVPQPERYAFDVDSQKYFILEGK